MYMIVKAHTEALRHWSKPHIAVLALYIAYILVIDGFIIIKLFNLHTCQILQRCIVIFQTVWTFDSGLACSDNVSNRNSHAVEPRFSEAICDLNYRPAFLANGLVTYKH